MSTVKALREQQARIATNARAKFDEIKDDTPAERAAEIEREFDAMMAEHDAIGARAERAEKLEAIERRHNAPDPRRPSYRAGDDRQDKREPEAGEISYRHVFAKIVCGVEPGELEPEERAILRQGATKFEQRTQTAGTASAGGYTVPTELAGFIDRAMKLWGPMYDSDVATVITTVGGNSLKVPTVDDTAVVAVASTEGAALTDDGGSDVTFGQKSLDAYSFDTEFVKWSWELDADSIFAMEQLLGDLLGERLARIANSQLTTGTGSSAPNGVVTASGLGKTAAATAAITSDEIIDLLHAVDPAYRQSPKARFMFNDSTMSAVRKLKDSEGRYLWQMGDITTGVPGTLLGYRYSINQAMDSLAAAKKVMLFGDFGKYYVRKVGGPVIGVMRERFWPALGIAGLIRFDGEIGQSGAIKHLITAAS
jgi:HK97 family phage major capsid protein